MTSSTGDPIGGALVTGAGAEYAGAMDDCANTVEEEAGADGEYAGAVDDCAGTAEEKAGTDGEYPRALDD